MTGRNRRPSPQTALVLNVLAAVGDGWLYGLQIAGRTGLKSGSLYPILTRLAERGQLEGRWDLPETPGRPARHAYRITVTGREALQTVKPADVAPRPVTAKPEGLVA